MHNRVNGGVSPCCQWRGEPLGSLRETPLKEILGGRSFQELREKMLSGRPPLGSGSCLRDERAGIASLRQSVNAQFLDRLPLEKPACRVLHLSFSNLCDYRCRTCGPGLSSSWYRDVGLLMGNYPDLPKPVVIRPAEDDDALLRQVESCLDEVEVLQFSSGGEPLIHDAHYRLLDLLLARGRTGVRLVYNTNFGTLEHGGRDVLALWNRFENVTVAASLDGMGPRGDYIRKGQDWERTVRNRERLLRECPRVDFMIAPTVSLYNALHLPDFHRDWTRRGYLRLDAFHLNPLEAPAQLCVQAFPTSFKERAAELYGRYARELAALGPAGRRAAGEFEGIVRFMRAADRNGELVRFRETTRVLDGLREEDAARIFPELAELLAP